MRSVSLNVQRTEGVKITHDHGQPRAISTSVQSTLWYGNALTISPGTVGGGWMSPSPLPLSAWRLCGVYVVILFRAHLLEWWKLQSCGLLLPDGGQHVHKGSAQAHSNLGISSARIVSLLSNSVASQYNLLCLCWSILFVNLLCSCKSSQAGQRYDLVVVGGGIVGMATAREVALRHPKMSIAVLEKENHLGTAKWFPNQSQSQYLL